MKRTSRIIMGIDPGIASCGYGLIRESRGNLESVVFGCIQTKPRVEFSSRLKIIHNSLKRLINKYQPDLMAVEEIFFCKNVKTALNVGQAKGVILLTTIQSKVPLQEFTPLQVKQALTGYGRADKMQIRKMVQCILKLPELPKSDDAADALAIAICAANTKEYKLGA